MIKILKANLWMVLSIILILVSGFIRFYDFRNRLNFGPEQAISLITSANYINEKISLLGQPDIIRDTSGGFTVFQGAWFNYSLVPLQLMFHYDPVLITAYFAFLNLLTAAILLYLVHRRLGWPVAFISTVFFLFNDRMIAHSLFVWILNYLPLIGILLFYLLTDKRKYFSPLFIFLIGLLSGAAFALEYAFLFTAIAVFLYTLYRSKNKFLGLGIFLLGAVIFNLPMVVFDLKHNFFHVFVFWQFTMDVISSKSGASWTYYHFLHFWPAICILTSFLVVKYLRQSYFIFLILAIYIFTNLNSPFVSFTKAVGMPFGLRYQDIYAAAKVIAQENKKEFNVVSLFDFDSRAHTLRYLLKYVLQQKPLDIDQYQDAKELFVFSPDQATLKKSQAFELQSFLKLPVEEISSISGKYKLYKITK